MQIRQPLTSMFQALELWTPAKTPYYEDSLGYAELQEEAQCIAIWAITILGSGLPAGQGEGGSLSML